MYAQDRLEEKSCSQSNIQPLFVLTDDLGFDSDRLFDTTLNSKERKIQTYSFPPEARAIDLAEEFWRDDFCNRIPVVAVRMKDYFSLSRTVKSIREYSDFGCVIPIMAIAFNLDSAQRVCLLQSGTIDCLVDYPVVEGVFLAQLKNLARRAEQFLG